MGNITGKIKNASTMYDDDMTNVLRGAIEHRATWLYLLLDEAKRNGFDYEKIGRDAVFRCGVVTAENKIKPNADVSALDQFFEPFIPEATRKALEVEVVEKNSDALVLQFHYCPLISAWQKLGATDQEIALLCDIAMDGDRGIAMACDYDFSIEQKIAEGDSICRVIFQKKGLGAND